MVSQPGQGPIQPVYMNKYSATELIQTFD